MRNDNVKFSTTYILFLIGIEFAFARFTSAEIAEFGGTVLSYIL